MFLMVTYYLQDSIAKSPTDPVPTVFWDRQTSTNIQRSTEGLSTFFTNNSLSTLLNKFQKYLFDTILSLTFWVPIIGIWSYFVVKLEGWELVSVIAGTALINASLGGLYGRVLNRWRRVFNYL